MAEDDVRVSGAGKLGLWLALGGNVAWGVGFYLSVGGLWMAVRYGLVGLGVVMLGTSLVLILRDVLNMRRESGAKRDRLAELEGRLG